MQIAVLIKQTPDTAAQIRFKPDYSGIVSDGVKYVISPYDEFALEEAIRIKEKSGGEVFCLSIGPERVKEALRNAMAMGADRAIWIDADESIDPYAAALLLSKKLDGLKPDLVWCGRQAVDDDMAYVGGAVAEMLGYPFVSLVTKFEVSEKSAVVMRQIEGGEERIEAPFPCVLSAQKGLNEPRYPSLAGMMKAKKKEIEEIKAPALVPEIASSVKTQIVKMEPPPPRAPVKMLSGTPDQMVKELAHLLKDEAKVL